jgi:hypothetical protein
MPRQNAETKVVVRVAAGSPTMRRRRLARELTRLREERGLTIREVATTLEWDPSKLSRVEGMQRGIIVRDVRKLLEIYGVQDEAQRETLFEMSRQSKQRGWWHAYSDAMLGTYANLVGLEAEASQIRSYEPELVPGLLQTEEYTRAVIRIYRPGDTAEQVGRRAQIKMIRQQILDRDDPPLLRVVLNEAVVRRLVGGRDVMREQLRKLSADRSRGNIQIQVLPFTAGEHPAMSGPFSILDFAEPSELGVVNLEGMRTTLSLETEDDLQAYGKAFDFLQAAALGLRPSRDMLIRLAEEI